MLLWGCLTLLRSRLALLLWGGLTLLWSRLALLRCSLALLRGGLTLLWGCLALLLHGLALLLLLHPLALLLLLLHSLTLLLLLSSLVLLLLLSRLVLLLLLYTLTLLLLSSLVLLLLLYTLTLLLLLSSLVLLLLHSLALLLLQRSGGPHVTVCRKRPVDGKAGRAAMIDVRKLSPVGAGSALILDLRPHGCGMLLTQRSQFRWSCAHLHSAPSAVETDTCAAPVAAADGAVVDVVHHGDVDVVDRAVVVEVAAAPVTALVADADIAKAVVDAAIVADVRAPVATVKSVAVMPEAPVAGGPESALVGSFNPDSGHPVVTR